MASKEATGLWEAMPIVAARRSAERNSITAEDPRHRFPPIRTGGRERLFPDSVDIGQRQGREQAEAVGLVAPY
jgi:hypothetical protein